MAILIRPVREQFEHDRVIRALELALGERFAVDVNVGDERKVPIKTGTGQAYPDLILSSTDAARKPVAIVEVETGESVNNLEAMYQWVLLAKARAQFRLYVPVACVDATRRLCAQHAIAPAEVWSYASLGGDQIRLERVFRDAGLPSDTSPPSIEPLVDIVSVRTRRASDIEAAVESAIQNPRREDSHPVDSRRAIAEAAAAAAAEPLRLPPLKPKASKPKASKTRAIAPPLMSRTAATPAPPAAPSTASSAAVAAVKAAAARAAAAKAAPTPSVAPVAGPAAAAAEGAPLTVPAAAVPKPTTTKVAAPVVAPAAAPARSAAAVTPAPVARSQVTPESAVPRQGRPRREGRVGDQTCGRGSAREGDPAQGGRRQASRAQGCRAQGCARQGSLACQGRAVDAQAAIAGTHVGQSDCAGTRPWEGQVRSCEGACEARLRQGRRVPSGSEEGAGALQSARGEDQPAPREQVQSGARRCGDPQREGAGAACATVNARHSRCQGQPAGGTSTRGGQERPPSGGSDHREQPLDGQNCAGDAPCFGQQAEAEVAARRACR